MKKLSHVCTIILILLVLAWFPAGALSQERAIFIDETAEKVFTPIKRFLHSIPSFDLTEPPEEISFTGSIPETILRYTSTQYDWLFWGYQRDDLLFFEVHDLFRSQKLLGIVRSRNDHSSMVQDVSNRLAQLFSLHRETKLLFSRKEPGQTSVILSALDGTSQTTLFRLANASINDLWMTPDTRSLVFTTNQNFIDEIYRLDLSTSNLQPLASNDRDNRYPTPFPLRREIIFWSNRNNQPAFYRMNEDGSAQRLLYSSSNPLRQPTVSSDGRLLAFCEYRNGQWALLIYDVLEIQSRLHPFSGNVSYPRFSPDDKTIIFVGESDGNSDLYLLDIVHDNTRRLTYDAIPKKYPSFSPDGKWVVFAGRKEVSWDIFLVSPEDFIVRRITSSRAEENFPSFTPYPVY